MIFDIILGYTHYEKENFTLSYNLKRDVQDFLEEQQSKGHESGISSIFRLDDTRPHSTISSYIKLIKPI